MRVGVDEKIFKVTRQRSTSRSYIGVARGCRCTPGRELKKIFFFWGGGAECKGTVCMLNVIQAQGGENIRAGEVTKVHASTSCNLCRCTSTVSQQAGAFPAEG